MFSDFFLITIFLITFENVNLFSHFNVLNMRIIWKKYNLLTLLNL